MLGKVIKLENEQYKFIPLNKEVIQKYPHLLFSVIKQDGALLSEQHYYEANYMDIQSKHGLFFVSILDAEKKWGEIGNKYTDVDAMLYGQTPIYNEPNQFKGEFKIGILREKFGGKIVLMSSSSNDSYIFSDESARNRALVGSTVQFLEIEETTDKPSRNKKAQVVSVLKCPFEKENIHFPLGLNS
jgi:hypothetical protein